MLYRRGKTFGVHIYSSGYQNQQSMPKSTSAKSKEELGNEKRCPKLKITKARGPLTDKKNYSSPKPDRKGRRVFSYAPVGSRFVSSGAQHAGYEYAVTGYGYDSDLEIWGALLYNRDGWPGMKQGQEDSCWCTIHHLTNPDSFEKLGDRTDDV
jgi:hypothetical protein